MIIFFLQKDTVQTIECTQIKEVDIGTPSTDVQTQKPNKSTEETGTETDITNRSERQEFKVFNSKEIIKQLSEF